jgi:hypothetical protein
MLENYLSGTIITGLPHFRQCSAEHGQECGGRNTVAQRVWDTTDDHQSLGARKPCAQNSESNLWYSTLLSLVKINVEIQVCLPYGACTRVICVSIPRGIHVPGLLQKVLRKPYSIPGQTGLLLYSMLFRYRNIDELSPRIQ